MKVSVRYAAEHFEELVLAADNGERVEIERAGKRVLRLEAVPVPVSRSLVTAPFEDEAISEDEDRVAAEARARGYAAPPNSHDELLRDLGLTVEDYERMAHEPFDAELPAASRG